MLLSISLMFNTYDDEFIDFDLESMDGGPVNPVQQCIICKQLVALGYQFLSGKSWITLAQFQEFIRQSCRLVPSSLRQPCFDVINVYGPNIYDVVLKNYPLDEVCSAARAC